MSEAPKAVATNKWLERGADDLPSVVVCRRALRRRIKAVIRLLPLATVDAPDPDHVHQLRVATRRTSAALKLLPHLVPKLDAKPLKEWLRRVRRAAAEARRADVHLAYFEGQAKQSPERAGQLESIIDELAVRRENAGVELRAMHHKSFADSITKQFRKIDKVLESPKPLARADTRSATFSLGQLAASILPPLVRPVLDIHESQLRNIPEVHNLRLLIKSLRYSLEIIAGGLPTRLWMDTRPQIEALQERLGALNDADERVKLLEELPAGKFGSVLAEQKSERGRAHREFLLWWMGTQGADLRAKLQELSLRCTEPAPPTPVAEPVISHHRIAALDVGTNSVRLVVAETDPKRGFRVIEDMKESCRLGGGMFADGHLTEEAMRRTTAAIIRLKAAAEQHHVEAIRAIGTAAVREAVNQDEFLEMVEREAGISLTVVDSEREARLAFASVAGAQDLSRRRVGVVDIGGGSTQVIISAGGLVDEIYPLKVGAVRLTERFAHLAKNPDEQFSQMRSAATEVVHKGIPRWPTRVETLVGVGGTCNNLARLAVRSGAATVGGGRFLFAVSGCELPYIEIVRILDWLRHMTPAERSQIAGLSEQRAEIIVAGATIIERVMDRLGVDRLQVHDGGVRDGLLAEMIDDLGLSPAPTPRKPADAIKAAREFADRACDDKPHAVHVARLSLHLFDRLAATNPDAAGAWASPEARVLLEIGALLHDCGTTINYKNHHRHGRDMILHADLPTLTQREREIVAQLARYHRKRGPHSDDEEFRHLSLGDQRLVEHLVGILRIADGLDRSHDQSVLQIEVVREREGMAIKAVARDKPSAGLMAARKKGNVFRRAFRVDFRIDWLPVAALATTE